MCCWVQSRSPPPWAVVIYPPTMVIGRGRNGQFAFRVLRLDGNQQTLLAEQHLTTDQAVQLEPVTPPNTRLDGRFEITGISVDPPRPSVGQAVALEVDATNSSRDTVTQAVPVLFVDESGHQLLATGTLSLAPGTSGPGQVYWNPSTPALPDAPTCSVRWR
jgi:hypothetical protein